MKDITCIVCGNEIKDSGKQKTTIAGEDYSCSVIMEDMECVVYNTVDSFNSIEVGTFKI